MGNISSPVICRMGSPRMCRPGPTAPVRRSRVLLICTANHYSRFSAPRQDSGTLSEPPYSSMGLQRCRYPGSAQVEWLGGLRLRYHQVGSSSFGDRRRANSRSVLELPIRRFAPHSHSRSISHRMTITVVMRIARHAVSRLRSPLEWKCALGHRWQASLASIIRGNTCFD